MAFPLIWKQSSHWETRMNQGEGELATQQGMMAASAYPLSLPENTENKSPAVWRLPRLTGHL